MRPRDIVRDLVPPLLWRSLRGMRRVPSQPVPAPQWEYIPEGWAYAQAHPEVRGWNVDEILDTYRRKWPRFEAMVRGAGPLGIAHESELVRDDDLISHNAIMTFAYVAALATGDRGRVSMLDWGGGIGHYYALARALLPKVAIAYHCKDVPLLAEYGAQLFPDQRFYCDDSCLAQRYDLVMASTSLHYSEDWKATLRSLAGATAGYLYVTGLPVVADRGVASFVFVQRPYAFGYNTEYLGWCLNRDEFLACARAAGMAPVREFVVGHHPAIAGAPVANEYRGFLFRPAAEVTS